MHLFKNRYPVQPMYYPGIVIANEEDTHNQAGKKEKVHLLQQYFVPSSQKRRVEVRECLKRNVANEHIDAIHLLNERIYSSEELGVESTKIKQTTTGRRLRYSDAIAYGVSLRGYLVISNSDIFFDQSLGGLYQTSLSVDRCCYALLRWEWRPGLTPYLFGPRPDSQDAWIFHQSSLPKDLRDYQFELGKPGCDNRLAWLLLRQEGMRVYNEPLRIKCFHFHDQESRSYYQTHPKNVGFVEKPYGLVEPRLTTVG